METCLCSYKKIFRKTNGRYLGYYLDRQSEEITQIEKDGWNGVDWNVLWQAREEVLLKKLSQKHAKIQKEKFPLFLETGKIEYIESIKTGLELFI
jgi:hypothetical protein